MSMQTQIQRIRDAKEAMRLSIIAKGVDVPISAKIDTYPSYIAQIVRSAQHAAFAVTNDITQYTSTEFVDVFDRATGKWYKLNDQNQFEPYGVYGTSPDDTKYVGKLIVYNGNEYEWTGSDWRYLGQVENQQVTYTYPEYIERPSANGSGVDLGEKFKENTVIKIKHSSTANGDSIIVDDKSSDQNDWRVFGAGTSLYYDFAAGRIYKSSQSSQFTPNIAEWEIGNYYVKNLKTGSTLVSGTKKTGFTRPCNLWLYCNPNISTSANDYGKVWYVQIYQDGVLVKDFVPWTEDGANGLFDFVSMTFTPCTGDMSVSTTMVQRTVGTVVYPKEYAAIVIPTPPPVSVTFNTMQDALGYTYVYYGLRATIDGSQYVYNSNNAWEEIHMLTGTKVGSGAMPLRVNGTTYDVTVLGPAVGANYNWMISLDKSVTITKITKGSTNYTDLVNIDFSDSSMFSQWTSVAGFAFDGCSNLTLSELPSSITSIGDSAFYKCSSLVSINLDNVTETGVGSFAFCTSLTNIYTPSMITVSRTSFYKCTKLTSVSIPNVTSIGEQAFYGTKLTMIELPSGVTSIGKQAFQSCTSLATVTCRATTPPTLGTEVFSSTSANLVIYVPAESVEAYKTATNWSTYASKIQAIIE